MNPSRKILVCLFSCFALLAGVLAPSLAAASTPSTFILGVLPIHSARVLVERYEPLRAYLEKNLQQPVRIESAPDFRGFHARGMRGDFDLSISPVHFARLLQKEAGGQPLARFTPDHDALLVYNADRPLARYTDLKGQQLAVIDRLAITVTAVLQFLQTQGLESDLDYKTVEHRSHASVAYSLISGHSAAAVTTSQGLLQMPDAVRQKLIVQKHIADVPAFFLIAKANMPKSRANQLKRILLAFPQEAEGAIFLGQTGYDNLIPANEAALSRADPYLGETIKALKP